MQKKLMKSLALVLASAALLTGCSGGTSTDTSSSSGNTSTGEASKSETTTKPEEINVMIWERGNTAPGTTQENNAMTKFIQDSMLEEYNVKVNFMPVPRSGSDDKVNVMMAGGNAPDVVFTYERSLFGDYATKGGLVDLAPYIAEFGPTLQTELAETLEVGEINGGQYAIPARRSLQKVKHAGYIRKDWVDALGMELPTTKQELIDILYAFKEQDPGNKGAALVPWAMGGNPDTEKYYLNFVNSYARTGELKDEYIYSDATNAFAPGAEEGFKVLNELYNDGIITKDFAVDTNDDKMKQDIANGNAGFFYDDNMARLSLMKEAVANDPECVYVPINAFENADGEYRNPADPLHGMYIMVPKTSENKAGAVVKYLNWLADKENAMKVLNTPEYTTDEVGLPDRISDEELFAQGYPLNLPDYCIVTQMMPYDEDKEAMVKLWSLQNPEFDQEYFSNMYDVLRSDLYTYPVVKGVLSEETKFLPSVKKLMIECAYKVISAPAGQFESVYATEYAKLEQAGLKQIFEAREAYYNENVANK